MSNTKEHILFTALKLILKKGYGNLTMNELVVATGLSKGAFYHYFKSKDQIYYETLDKYFFSYLASFNLIYNHDISFKENLDGITDMFVDFVKEISSLIGDENSIINYYQTILDAAIRSEEIKFKMQSYYEYYISKITEWIQIAQKNKEISKNFDAEILSKHISALLEGIMIIFSFQDKEKDIKIYLKEIFNQFLIIILNTK